jgi:uncharacterized protein
LLYGVNPQCPEYSSASSYLEDLFRQNRPFCLTWVVCYEFLRVSTHPRVFPRPLSLKESTNFLGSILSLPQSDVLLPTSRHWATLAEVFERVPDCAGNMIHDVQNAVLALEHGIREIVTADTDFHRFDFLRVVDPVHKKPS